MGERIEIKVRVRAFLKKRGAAWIATAPRFGVASQGKSRSDAERCLKEALELWIESCVERGTLDDALREIGFQPTPWDSTPESEDRVLVKVARAAKEPVLGQESEIEISIPAYQVAAIQKIDRASTRQ